MDTIDYKTKQIQQELERLLEVPDSVKVALRVDEVLSLLLKQITTVHRSADYIKQLELLQEVAGKLVEIRKLDELAQHILEGASRLIPFTDGSIGFVDEGMITFPYAIGNSADSVMSFRIPVGQGLTGWVVKHRRPIRIGDTSQDERYHDQIKATKSELDVPIIYRGESIGVINVESTHINAFSEDHERLLTTLAGHAAIAVKNAQLFNQMNALANITRQLSSTLRYDSVLVQILETVSELIKSPEVSVGILNSEANTLQFIQARGPSKDKVLRYEAKIDTGLTGLAVRMRKPVRVGNVTEHPEYQAQIGNTRSELDVPLLSGEDVIGVLNAESPNINAFSEDDEALLVAVASHAALAIKNAGLYQEIREELEVTLSRQESAERMALIGDVAGNLVHRMNNDVGAIRVRANQIISLANNESIRDKAQTIKDLADKVLGQFQEFRERYRDVESVPLDVNWIIRAVVQEVPIPDKVTVVETLASDLEKTYAAEPHLKEVLRNLVANAVEAMPAGGNLLISSSQSEKTISVQVQDTGTGISDKDRSQIFDLGFSTKMEGKGLGYGLFWVKTYLNRIGGRIELEATGPGKGSTFTVFLPVYKM